MFYDSFANRKRNKYGKILSTKSFENLAKVAAGYSPAKILEIGIGQGIFYEKLKKEIPQMEYTGIEASDTMYDEAKKKGINAIKCFVPPFPAELERNGFDMVVMFNVLEHFVNYREVLEVMNGVSELLKPNGKFLLYYPCARDWGTCFFECDYSHSYATTQYRTENLLHDSGFKVIGSDSYRACFNNFRPFFYIISRLVDLFPFLSIGKRIAFKKTVLTVAEKIPSPPAI